jgi:GTP:adenosylcobinamide-phosphate guanylyltransferase
MKTAVFSLCNGDGKRFSATAVKQLVDVDGEVLLLRTARQVNACGHNLCVVTHNVDIINRTRDYVVLRIMEPTPSIVATALSLEDMWEDRTIFLLGDVYYTDDVLLDILDEKADLRFFGDNSEIFALVARRASHRKLKEALQKALKFGRFWNLYRVLAGVPIRVHRIEGLFKRVEDETDDIDTVEDYKRLVQRLRM